MFTYWENIFLTRSSLSLFFSCARLPINDFWWNALEKKINIEEKKTNEQK